jgi:hypothetical protein
MNGLAACVRWIRVAVLGGAVALPLPAVAAEPWWCGQPIDPTHPLAWDRLGPDVTERLERGRIRAAYELVLERYRSAVSGLADDPDTPMRRTAHEAVTAYLQSLDAGAAEAPAAWGGAEIPGARRVVYELGPWFDGDDARALAIECRAFAPERPPNVAETTAYLVRAMRRVGEAGGVLARAQSAAAGKARELYAAYGRMVADGLPMWPWELWVNGWRVPDDFDAPPPRTQLVVLRPSLAPALRFDGEADSELDSALLLEPLGFVRYGEDGYADWWGASLLVTLTGDNGIGLGAQLRRNEYTLGVAHHDRGNDVLLYVSVDLYGLVMGPERRTSDADAFLEGVRERLKGRLKERMSGDPGGT